MSRNVDKRDRGDGKCQGEEEENGHGMVLVQGLPCRAHVSVAPVMLTK